MAKIVRMSDYAGSAGRDVPEGADGRRQACDAGGAARDTELRLGLDDLLGRDYGKLEDVVRGILRIRDILDRHVGPDPEWQRLLLDLLRESCRSMSHGRFGRPRQARGLRALPRRAAPRIQEYIEGHIGGGNVLELGTAVVILKLMEHTPAARRLLR